MHFVAFLLLDGTTFYDTTESNEVGGAEHYIEVLVVADKSVVDYHGKSNVEKYLATMMSIVCFFFLFNASYMLDSVVLRFYTYESTKFSRVVRVSLLFIIGSVCREYKVSGVW